MKRAAGNTTSVIEVLRLNINQFEQAVGRGDDKTAKRCIDAAELMFRGLRDVASGQGCDVGSCPASDTPAPEPMPEPRRVVPTTVIPPPPTAPEALGITRAEFEHILTERLGTELLGRTVAPGWLTFVARRQWSLGVFARLTWAWVCCAAGLAWRALCWLCRGLRRTP